MDVILSLVSQYPQVAAALAAIGTARLIFKPLFSFLQTAVNATPTPVDNQWLATVMNSTVYKAVAYALDLLGSIKLPQAKQ